MFRACFVVVRGGRRAESEHGSDLMEAAPEWIYGGRSKCRTATKTARRQM